jgi:sucrose-phosphate synthase
MHIAFLNPQGNFDSHDSHWSEHPDFGGGLVYVKELAIAMAMQGHQIDIITRQIIDPDWPEFAAPMDHYDGIRNVNILRVPCGPKRFLSKDELWPYLADEWVSNILDVYLSIGALPDAFAGHYGTGGFAAALLWRETGRPFTFTGRSLGAQEMDELHITPENLAEFDNRYLFSRRILAERISMQYAGRVITSTSFERKEEYGHRVYLGAANPNDDSLFVVIPPGVNRKVFSPARSALDLVVRDRIKAARKRDIPKRRRKLPIVLLSSRLDPVKNHLGLIKVFALNQELRQRANLGIGVPMLEDPLHDFRLLKDGERAVMKDIVAAIDDAGLWNAITAFQLNNQAELAAAYRVLSKRGSVFVLASFHEPFGLAPLEAMSCGLPVVVTRNGGPSDSIVEAGQEFGVLVDPQDPADIADGILRVLESSKVWRMFAKAGIKRVTSKYTWDRTAKSYLSIIDELVRCDQAPKDPLQIPSWFSDPSSGNEDALKTLSALYFG